MKVEQLVRKSIIDFLQQWIKRMSIYNVYAGFVFILKTTLFITNYYDLSNNYNFCV